MSNIVFPANELLEYSSYQLDQVLTGEFHLEFSDGVLFTNDRETNFTMPLWDYIRDRKIPLKKHHHLTHLMAQRMFHKNIHMDILSNIYWDIYEEYRQFGRFGDYELLEKLTAELYQHSNKQYNLQVIRMEDEVVGVSIVDVVQLFDIPEVHDILKTATPTEQSVIAVNNGITKLFSKSKSPAVANKMMVRMARAGVIKAAQLVQAVAPTGYIEDIDGSIFKYPLMSNYTDGHRSLYDNMVESRKAGQAIEATKAELEEAVYQSRRQEILNEIIMTVHPGDCGTKSFTPTKLVQDNGLTESDLVLHAGKYYFDAGGNPADLKEIRPTDEFLYGRIINMRSILHCAHADSNGVCETCLGTMALTIPRRTNLGQLMTTDLYAFIIQLQLSKKHHLANSIIQKLSLSDDDKKFLAVGNDGISYYFTEHMQNAKFKITIPHDDGKSLTDVLYLADITKISIARLTEIGSIRLEIDYGAYTDARPFILGTGKRKASFSHEMLAFVKEKYWDTDEKSNNFIIDMEGWDVTKPFAYVPMKNDSMADFSLGFKAHIESDVKKEDMRDTMIDPDEYLKDTYDLLNRKLSINMAQVEVAVLGIMIRSAKNDQYALPKPWSDRGVGVMSLAMALRSLAATMAFEKHTIIFNSVKSFINKNRPDHPMDAILHPELIPEMKKSGFLV